MHIIPATPEVFSQLKTLNLHKDEGLFYIKLVAIKPQSAPVIENVLNNKDGVLVCGAINEIKEKFIKWFDELIVEYKKEINNE